MSTITEKQQQTCVQAGSHQHTTGTQAYGHTVERLDVCMIYSYAKLLALRTGIMRLMTASGLGFALLFPLSFSMHAARVQNSTFISSHIAPFFHIYICVCVKFVRTLLLACTNVNFKLHSSPYMNPTYFNLTLQGKSGIFILYHTC